jgi:hypothetical protein
LRHQTQFVIGHCREDVLHFLARENRGQAFVFDGARKIKVSDFDLEYVLVEVQDGLQGLVLG